jgi:hypothetical protein
MRCVRDISAAPGNVNDGWLVWRDVWLAERTMTTRWTTTSLADDDEQARSERHSPL